MNLDETRTAYIAFEVSKGHVPIPSAPLVPENDPTTLFTGSGMQPLIPYLLGKDHPAGSRLVNSQKCFRSGDIEEVGDNRHTTFFEMLGNWSLGDYGKDEQLPWFFSFLTDILGLDPTRLYVTVFSGDESAGVPRDEVSAEIWKELFASRGIVAKVADMITEEGGASRGMHDDERIFYYRDKNWWSRAGSPEKMPAGEPGGPDSEVFYRFDDVPHNTRFGAHCHVNCDCGQFLEVGNSVFMQYYKHENGTFAPLPKPNVDFGGGLERLMMAVHNTADIIKVCHAPILAHLERVTGKQYGVNEVETKAFRVIADHMKASVFLIGDGVYPSNTDQGYFVRRLIRRAVRYADQLGITKETFAEVVEPIVCMYGVQYPILRTKVDEIRDTIAHEEQKFRLTLARGLKKFEKTYASSGVVDLKQISGETLQKTLDEHPIVVLPAEEVFHLITTDGFPRELIEEVAKERTLSIDWNHVEELLQAHKELSRAGSEQKFKGGLADAGESTTMLHTCTHLMLAGLRKYLGTHVHQAGSNITAERTRFDFTHPERVPREILDKVEAYVNEAIQKGCTVFTVPMEKKVAQDTHVEGSFWEKYPEQVTVFEVRAPDGTVYSRELCGGPHVEHTSRIQGSFKIVKEESSSAGVRRIKAILVRV